MPGEHAGHPFEVSEESADLHIGKFPRDVGRHIGAADLYAWCQSLLLIPPAATLCVCQKPQVLSVRKNAHRVPPEMRDRTDR